MRKPYDTRRRHTEILGVTSNAEGKITVLMVAAAFMQYDSLPLGHGVLCYVCPVCGGTHFHRTHEGVFGDSDGERSRKCHDVKMWGGHASGLHLLMADSWSFHLVEVEDFNRAGSFHKLDKPSLLRSVGIRKPA